VKAETHHNILIVSEANEKAWRVMCLSHEVRNSTAPHTMNLDGIEMHLVAWACNTSGDYPIYLQITDMSRAKQRFALNTAFRALKENGYRLEEP